MKSRSDWTPHLPTLISYRPAMVFDGISLTHWRDGVEGKTGEMGEHRIVTLTCFLQCSHSGRWHRRSVSVRSERKTRISVATKRPDELFLPPTISLMKNRRRPRGPLHSRIRPPKAFQYGAPPAWLACAPWQKPPPGVVPTRPPVQLQRSVSSIQYMTNRYRPHSKHVALPPGCGFYGCENISSLTSSSTTPH